jgi:hypothetical protein
VVVGGGGGGGEVVGGEVGGGLVVAGVVGAGFAGAGMVGPGLLGFAGACVGRVVVEEDGFDPDGDVGTVAAGVELVVPVRLIVPFDLTVNQLFAKPCPPACVWELSAAKKYRA